MLIHRLLITLNCVNVELSYNVTFHSYKQECEYKQVCELLEVISTFFKLDAVSVAQTATFILSKRQF